MRIESLLRSFQRFFDNRRYPELSYGVRAQVALEQALASGAESVELQLVQRWNRWIIETYEVPADPATLAIALVKLQQANEVRNPHRVMQVIGELTMGNRPVDVRETLIL